MNYEGFSYCPTSFSQNKHFHYTYVTASYVCRKATLLTFVIASYQHDCQTDCEEKWAGELFHTNNDDDGDGQKRQQGREAKREAGAETWEVIYSTSGQNLSSTSSSSSSSWYYPLRK